MAELDLDSLERQALAAWNVEAPPPSFAERVVARTAAQAKRPRIRGPIVLVAAAVVVGVVGLGAAVYGAHHYRGLGSGPRAPETASAVPGLDEEDEDAATEGGAIWEAPELPEDFEDRVDRYLSSYGEHYGPAFEFQGVVLVARDGEIVFSRGYGRSDLTPPRAGGSLRRNDLDTRFRIGSLTQQFTAVATLQLVEQGKLGLDDFVAEHLPEMADVPDVRVRHLLTHTSGLWNFTDDPVFELTKSKPHAHDEIIARVAAVGTHFQPGTEFEATNSNYLLLGRVIERVTGAGYAAYVSEHVLQPSGMTHTSFGDAYDTGEQARGYAFNEEEFLEPAEDIFLPNMGGAAGMVSTPRDMVRWDKALYDGTLLSPETTEAMLRPVLEKYAMGWVVGRAFDRKVASHPGGVDGFNAHFMRFVDDHTMVLAIANTEVVDCRRIAGDIAAAVYDRAPQLRIEHQAIHMDAQRFDSLEGRYLLSDKTRRELGPLIPARQLEQLSEVRVERDGDRLWMRVPGHGSKWMHPLADRRFFFKDDAGTVGKFFGGADEAPRWLVLEQQGREFLLERAP